VAARPALATAAMVPQPVHAIEVPSTAVAASVPGQAVVAPRDLAVVGLALRVPAVVMAGVGRAAATAAAAAAAARPCNHSCKREFDRSSEGASHYAPGRSSRL
jgi:hypothetical protein